MFALSLGFQNGMSWPHCTKTHKLVRVLGIGPFPDQGTVGGAHGAGSPTQQYDYFAEQTLKISVYFMQWIKSYSIFTDRQMHILHGQDFFPNGNLHLSLHYVPLFASLTSFVKDKETSVGNFWTLRFETIFDIPKHEIFLAAKKFKEEYEEFEDDVFEAPENNIEVGHLVCREFPNHNYHGSYCDIG